MSAEITIPADLARELAYNGVGDAAEGFTVVAIEEGEARRWTRTMRLIVSRDSDGALFAGYYQEGLTEQQETEPWEFATEAKFQPVERRTRMIERVEYVRVSQVEAANGGEA